MNKTILLEIDEKEVEVLEQALIKERTYWEEDTEEVGRIMREKCLEICDSLWAKLDNAKHNKPDVLITSQDFFNIKDLTHREFHNLPAEVYISKKKMEENDIVKISLTSAVIMWLNGKGLLKQLAKFDFTDHSSEYEEMEE